MKKKVVKGYHDIYCYMCGKNFSEIIHWGGKKKLKTCAECEEIKILPCPDCMDWD